MTVLQSRPNKGLSRSQGVLHSGQNSGYQAINLAYLMGAEVILLLGYDMARRNGKGHFFGEHPETLNHKTDYRQFITNFDSIKPDQYGIEIINCTRDTALTAFPKMDLEKAII